MPRMKNKARPDGRVQAKVHIGNGKYKYVYAATNKELEKKVQELKIKLGKGLDLTADRDTFGFWAEKWLKLKQTEVSVGRFTAYKARCNNLTPIFDFKINALRTADIQELILNYAAKPAKRTGKPYSKATLTEIKHVAGQVLQLAIENRVLDYNCAYAVKIPKAASESKRRALTDEEQRWIVDTPHRAQTAAMIMMYAGLRRGELLALVWEDVDLNAGAISVTKSVEFVNGKPILKSGGKTDAATRTVFIPRNLVEYLKTQPHARFSLVCPSAKGALMSDIAWRRMWDSYLNDLNLKYGDWENCLQTKGVRPSKYAPGEKPLLIPRFTAHWLRHTYITLLYMAGVDVLTAKEQAGHADIKTTMEIYTHLDEKFKRKSISKLDEYLSSKQADGCQMGVRAND